MNTRFYLYVKAFSDLGSMMDTIVLTSVMYGVTHSSLWVSLTFAVRTIAGFLSSLSSGVLADRIDRRKIMVMSDILRAASILVLIADSSPVMILLMSFFIGFFTSYFAVGFNAAVPQMFAETDMVVINALISRLSSVSMVGGFFLAGVLSEYFGYRVVLTLDFISYICSALALLKIRFPSLAIIPADASHGRNVRSGQVNSSTSTTNVSQSKRSTWQDLKAVRAYLWTQPLLLIVFAGYLVETFSASSHNVGIPLLAAQIAPDNQTFVYGLIWGVWGIGNVLSTLVMPKLAFIKKHLYATYWISTLSMSIGFITFLSSHSLRLVLPFALLTGIFDAGSVTLCNVIMQQTDNEIRGRVFGVSTFINRLGFGTGFFVVPMLLAHMSLTHMVWCLHGLNILAVLASLMAARKHLAQRTRRAQAIPL